MPNLAATVTARLLEGSKLPSGDVDALHRLASQIRCCLSTLDQVGRASDLDCPAYLVKIVGRLPGQMQEQWAEIADRLICEDNEPKLSDLLAFIEKRASVFSSVYGQLASKSQPQASLYRVRTESRFEAVSRHQPCLECGLEHQLGDCNNFLKRTPLDRVDFLKKIRFVFRAYDLITWLKGVRFASLAKYLDVIRHIIRSFTLALPMRGVILKSLCCSGSNTSIPQLFTCSTTGT